MNTIEDFFFFFSEAGLISDKSSLYYKAVLAHLLVTVPIPEIGMEEIEDKARYVRSTIDTPFITIVDCLYENKEIQQFLKEHAIQTSNLMMNLGDLSGQDISEIDEAVEDSDSEDYFS